MNQYCRYCGCCFDAGDFRCGNHPKGLEPHWDRKHINRLNHCPNFALSDLGDVETGRMYKPRNERVKRAKKREYTQMRMEGV